MATVEYHRAVSLQRHIEDMRSLITCKICLRPLYEPYTLACGHTYCYGCLRSWFKGNDEQGRRKRKNCPDCRAEVTAQPAPNYIMRDMTHMFVDRVELLPEGETVTDHVREKEQEATQLTVDRADAGLFGGVFRGAHRHMAPIQDVQDGVIRCPNCMFELEDGECNQCGWYDSDISIDDDDELSINSEDESDMSDINADLRGSDIHRPPLPRVFHGIDLDESDDDTNRAHADGVDSIDLEHFVDMDDVEFTDEDYPDEVDDDGISDVSSHTGRTYSTAHTIDDDSGDDVVRPTHRYSHIGTARHVQEDDEGHTNHVGSSEEDDLVVTRQPPVRRGRNVVVMSSEDEDDTHHDAAERPARHSSPVSERATSAVDDSSESDEVGSESEHDDDTSSSGSSSEGSSATITPPQPTTRRQQHLHDQRTRRDNKTSSAPQNRPLSWHNRNPRNQSPMPRRGPARARLAARA